MDCRGHVELEQEVGEKRWDIPAEVFDDGRLTAIGQIPLPSHARWHRHLTDDYGVMAPGRRTTILVAGSAIAISMMSSGSDVITTATSVAAQTATTRASAMRSLARWTAWSTLPTSLASLHPSG